jgi:pimeloyl-ACP methyl ester carboxylesterase
MGRGWKILIGVGVLAVLLTVNTLLIDGETKSAEATEPGGRILALDGGDVQVVDRGPRHGSPIVLLHCYTCAIDWWDRMMPLLERRHRVVAIDMLGFGGAEKPGSGYSMTDQAALVDEALSRLGVDDATVVGHSMGGTVATALSEIPGGPVARLVDIDQAPNNDDYEKEGLPFTAKLAFMPVLGPTLWRILPDASIEEGLEKAFAPDHDVPDAFIEDFRRQTYTSFDDAAQAETDFLDEESLDSRLRGSGIPVLAIFGAEEQLYEPEKALAAFVALPGAETALVQGAGHSPNVERPSRTAALVLGFAAGDTPGGPTARHRVQNGVQTENPVRPRP